LSDDWKKLRRLYFARKLADMVCMVGLAYITAGMALSALKPDLVMSIFCLVLALIASAVIDWVYRKPLVELDMDKVPRK